MTDYCKIGPISITNPHMVDSDDYKSTEEEFEVYCTHWQYKQLLALEDTNYTSKATIGVTLVYGRNPWSPVFIDSSLLIDDNDFLKHKGWYIVTNVEISSIYRNKYLKAKIKVIKLSAFEEEILTMDYTTGINDGTTLNTKYAEKTKAYLLQDDFTIFDTSKWNSPISINMSAGTVTASNGTLQFAATAATQGVEGKMWIQSNETYNASAGVTIELDMSLVSTPSTAHSNNSMNFWISSSKSISSEDWNASVVLAIGVNDAGGKDYNAFVIKPDGTWVTVIPTTSMPTTSIKWKFISSGRYFDLYVDTGSGYEQKTENMWTDLQDWNNLYFGYSIHNNSTTSATVSTSNLNIYKYVEAESNNVVTLPASSVAMTAPDFTRTCVEGTINCYKNPITPIHFQTADPYAGSVKAFTNNNGGNGYRQMFSVDEIPDAPGFYVENGLIKLDVISSEIVIYYWNGTTWAILNTLNLGSLTLLKLLSISPEKVTFQANTTKWTLERGKPFCRVEHPNDDLNMNVKNTIRHDGIIESVLAGQDVTMQQLNHAELLDGYINLADENQADGGEDGTINGFETEGNVEYENLLSLEQSQPGYNGNTAGWAKATTTTVLTPITDSDPTRENVYQGVHSLKVQGDGSTVGAVLAVCAQTIGANKAVSQGIKIKGTAGKTLNFGLLQYDGTTIAQKTFTATGNWDTIKYEDITTLSTTSTVYIQVWETTASTEPFYLGLAQLETGSVLHSWIPGQTTGNTVTIGNLQDYNQTIRACGFTAVPTAQTLQSLESKGLTDCFYEEGHFMTDYSTFKTNVQNFLTNIQDTNLKLHVVVPPFTKADGTPADPTDTTYQNAFKAQTAQTFADCPNLTGLSFNDYLYPDAYWNSAEDAQMQLNLQSFADMVRTAVHTAKSTATFSINVYPVSSHSSGTAVVSGHCDLIMVENYRLFSWVPDGTDSHAWFKSSLESNITDAGSTPLICDIITFNTKDSDYTISEIIKDVNIALNHNISGYMLWQYGYGPDASLYFPDGKAYQGTHSIQIQTGGYKAGEGVKIPISGMTTDKIFSGQIRVKAPTGVNLSFKLGSGTTKTLTGDGTYKLISDSEIPSDGYLYVITTSALATAFNIDCVGAELGSTLHTWGIGVVGGSQYNLQIIKTEPCTIKSNKIPASSLTGIGVYDSTLTDEDYNSASKLALEFPAQPDQHIGMKQV